MNDPELRAHLAQVYPLSQSQEQQWLEATLRLEPALQPFAIEARLATRRKGFDLTLVGTIGFHNLDWRNRTAELGMFLGPREVWGKGYGTEALRVLAAFAFGELNLNRLWLRVYEDNARARRSYEKGGVPARGSPAAGPLPRGPIPRDAGDGPAPGGVVGLRADSIFQC